MDIRIDANLRLLTKTMPCKHWYWQTGEPLFHVTSYRKSINNNEDVPNIKTLTGLANV
jgi:hypothetical protein